MSPQQIAEYLKQSRSIRGWFWPAAAYLFGLIEDHQHRSGVAGDFFEIGAFHGKSTLLLAHMARNRGQTLGVCDLFGADDEAHARDGRGFYSTFHSNLSDAFDSLDFLRVFIKPSNRLTPTDTTLDCRFFHIDGDHEAESVASDLMVAAGAVNERGVVIVDDIYNFAWPGVAEGFFRFMANRPGELSPIAMGFNKLVLCRPAARALYESLFDDAAAPWRFVPRGPTSLKTLDLCGWKTRVFHVPSYRSPDPLRATLTMLYQHAPRLSDRVSRLVRYHARAGTAS